MRARPSKLQKATKARLQPRLGIFWVVGGRLLLDSTPLSESELNGNYRNYPQSHIDVWEAWRASRKVPPESEYEEFPRGRIVYDIGAATFTLLADRCILSRKDLIEEIKRELHLPRKITLGTDFHYRCFECLYGKR